MLVHKQTEIAISSWIKVSKVSALLHTLTLVKAQCLKHLNLINSKALLKLYTMLNFILHLKFQFTFFCLDIKDPFFIQIIRIASQKKNFSITFSFYKEKTAKLKSSVWCNFAAFANNIWKCQLFSSFNSRSGCDSFIFVSSRRGRKILMHYVIPLDGQLSRHSHVWPLDTQAQGEKLFIVYRKWYSTKFFLHSGVKKREDGNVIMKKEGKPKSWPLKLFLKVQVRNEEIFLLLNLAKPTIRQKKRRKNRQQFV